MFFEGPTPNAPNHRSHEMGSVDPSMGATNIGENGLKLPYAKQYAGNFMQVCNISGEFVGPNTSVLEIKNVQFSP